MLEANHDINSEFAMAKDLSAKILRHCLFNLEQKEIKPSPSGILGTIV
jgi:hypothetical protein